MAISFVCWPVKLTWYNKEINCIGSFWSKKLHSGPDLQKNCIQSLIKCICPGRRIWTLLYPWNRENHHYQQKNEWETEWPLWKTSLDLWRNYRLIAIDLCLLHWKWGDRQLKHFLIKGLWALSLPNSMYILLSRTWEVKFLNHAWHFHRSIDEDMITSLGTNKNNQWN